MDIVHNRRVMLQTVPDLSREAQDLVSDLQEAEAMFENRKVSRNMSSNLVTCWMLSNAVYGIKHFFISLSLDFLKSLIPLFFTSCTQHSLFIP